MQTPTEVLDPPPPTLIGSEEIPHATETGLNGDAHRLPSLLHALQAMRVGDFSVRMRGDRIGIMARSPIHLMKIVATNQRMAKQVAGRPGGRPKARPASAFSWLVGRAWGGWTSVNSLIDDLLWPTRNHPRHRRRRQGDSCAGELDVDAGR